LFCFVLGISSEYDEDKQEGNENMMRSGSKTVAETKSPQQQEGGRRGKQAARMVPIPSS
jgi:hypothetical protein